MSFKAKSRTAALINCLPLNGIMCIITLIIVIQVRTTEILHPSETKTMGLCQKHTVTDGKDVQQRVKDSLSIFKIPKIL